jgi:heme-degrading monooxygenase HmoA
MVARTWRGWTRSEDADEYAEYIADTGLRAYRETSGNRGAWIMRREEDGRTLFVTLSFWDSLDAVRAFAGDDIERAVYYPEDDRFLIEREDRVDHWELQEF